MTKDTENRDERLRAIEKANEEARRRKREERAPLNPDRDLSWNDTNDFKDYGDD